MHPIASSALYLICICISVVYLYVFVIKKTETSERLQLLTDMILASENTSGIHSPVASSTLGTPMKR